MNEELKEFIEAFDAGIQTSIEYAIGEKDLHGAGALSLVRLALLEARKKLAAGSGVES